MSVLIIFETVEGQTRKIARFAENQILKIGQSVVLFDAADKITPPSFVGVEKVILAAPVHERRHPRAFEEFITANLHTLQVHETLLISVSLKAAFPEGLEEAKDFLIEMEMRTGFTPNFEALVAGAVRTNSYDYFAAMVVQQVILREQDYDLEDGEREFTDWKALEAKLSEFLGVGASSVK